MNLHLFISIFLLLFLTFSASFFNFFRWILHCCNDRPTNEVLHQNDQNGREIKKKNEKPCRTAEHHKQTNNRKKSKALCLRNECAQRRMTVDVERVEVFLWSVHLECTRICSSYVNEYCVSYEPATCTLHYFILRPWKVNALYSWTHNSSVTDSLLRVRQAKNSAQMHVCTSLLWMSSPQIIVWIFSHPPIFFCIYGIMDESVVRN